ncbi:MAG: bifunctional heptose 7-phosphate kinase/heptose 1-phosphate adenyltransferase [Terriglobia bacterium]
MAAISSHRLRRLIQGFRGRRVSVVGDVMLDRFVRGRVTRLSPEAPVPVVEVDHLDGTPHPGGAANVVANLRSLGALAIPFGVVGRDPAGRALRGQLKRIGVPVTGLVADPNRHTTVKVRISSGHLHIVRVDWEERAPLGRKVETQLLERFQRELGKVAAVVVSDYDKGTLTDNVLRVVLNSARARNIPVFVDLKRWRAWELAATLVLVNERRAAEMTQRDIRDTESARVAGWQLLEALDCRHLVMTRGSEGMMIFDRKAARDGAPMKHRPWEVFDVTGAGDTVIAALTLSLVAGATLWEAAEVANHAAGVVVSKPGTAACSPAELLASLRRTGLRRNSGSS